MSGPRAETPAESGAGAFPSAPLRVPLSRLRQIEAELICADEADAEFGSGEPVAPAVPPAVPPAAAQRPAQAPGDSRWLRAGGELRAALREGSARCRQRDFAAAAARFCTALEVTGLKGLRAPQRHGEARAIPAGRESKGSREHPPGIGGKC